MNSKVAWERTRAEEHLLKALPRHEFRDPDKRRLLLNDHRNPSLDKSFRELTETAPELLKPYMQEILVCCSGEDSVAWAEAPSADARIIYLPERLLDLTRNVVLAINSVEPFVRNELIRLRKGKDRHVAPADEAMWAWTELAQQISERMPLPAVISDNLSYLRNFGSRSAGDAFGVRNPTMVLPATGGRTNAEAAGAIRFTLAHEASHHLLNHLPKSQQKQHLRAPGPSFLTAWLHANSIDIGENHSRPHRDEFEADLFGLLLYERATKVHLPSHSLTDRLSTLARDSSIAILADGLTRADESMLKTSKSHPTFQSRALLIARAVFSLNGMVSAITPAIKQLGRVADSGPMYSVGSTWISALVLNGLLRRV